MSHKSNGRPLPAHGAEVGPEEEETVAHVLAPTAREDLLTLGYACIDFVFSAEMLYLAIGMGDEDMLAVYSDRYWQYAAVVDETLLYRGLKEREWDARRLRHTLWNLTETLALLVRRWLRIMEGSGLAEMDLTQDGHQPELRGFKPFWEGHGRLYRSLYQDAIYLLGMLNEPVADASYIPFSKLPSLRELAPTPPSGNGTAAPSGNGTNMGKVAREKIVRFFRENPRPEWKTLEETTPGVGSKSEQYIAKRLQELVRGNVLEHQKGKGLWRLIK